MSAPVVACIVYKITNLLNGKCYVGLTTTPLERRMASHRHDAKTASYRSALYGAVRKYGWENFRIEVLESAIAIETLGEREAFWIKECNALVPNGYNLTSGGERPRHTTEAKKRMSLSHLGKKRGPMSEETKRKIGDANRGRQFSDKQRRRMSESAKASSWFVTNPPSKETLSQWASKSKGVRRPPRTEAWKQKMRAKNSGYLNPFFGKTHTPETREKLRRNHRGPELTQEYRQKISTIAKAGWNKRKANQLCHQLSQTISKT